MADYVNVSINGQAKAAMLVASAGINATAQGDSNSRWSYAAPEGGLENTTVAATLKGAAGAGLSNYINWLEFSTDMDITNATELVIRNGAGGPVLWRTQIGVDGLITGRVIHFNGSVRSSPNTLLEIATLTATGSGAFYINAGGTVG